MLTASIGLQSPSDSTGVPVRVVVKRANGTTGRLLRTSALFRLKGLGKSQDKRVFNSQAKL